MQQCFHVQVHKRRGELSAQHAVEAEKNHSLKQEMQGILSEKKEKEDTYAEQHTSLLREEAANIEEMHVEYAQMKTAVQDISTAEFTLARRLEDIEHAAMETAEAAIAQMRMQAFSHEEMIANTEAEIRGKSDLISSSGRSELNALEKSARYKLNVWQDRAIADAERKGAIERRRIAAAGAGEFGQISTLLRKELARVWTGPYSEGLRKALANLPEEFSTSPASAETMGSGRFHQYRPEPLVHLVR
jgi:hypothetical protein